MVLYTVFVHKCVHMQQWMASASSYFLIIELGVSLEVKVARKWSDISNAMVTLCTSASSVRNSCFVMTLIIGRRATTVWTGSPAAITSFAVSWQIHQSRRCDMEHLVHTLTFSFIAFALSLQVMQSLWLPM